jgi:hypothetical protein
MIKETGSINRSLFTLGKVEARQWGEREGGGQQSSRPLFTLGKVASAHLSLSLSPSYSLSIEWWRARARVRVVVRY